MARIILERNSIRFVDAQGRYRFIYGCPLKQRGELNNALNDLDDRLAKSTCKTIAEIYDHDPEFQAIADFCLGLCKIDPNWLDIEMLQQFLLSFEGDGKAQAGLLRSLNFPEPKLLGGKGSTYPEAVAAMWSHTGDLRKALQELGYNLDEQVPWAELAEVLEARNKAADPDAAQEEEAIAAFAEDFRDLSDFGLGNGARMATDQETAVILGGI